MKKQLQLLCLCATTAFNLSAQTVGFIEPRNVQNVPEADFFTYKVGDNFYVLQKKYRMMAPVMYDLQLDAYDANRKPIGSNMIDKTLEMGDANIYEGIFAGKDNLVMFKSEFSKASGSKVSYIYAYPFDVTGKRGKKTLLTSFDAESAFNAGNFEVNASPDGSKIAVMSELPYVKDGMESCVVTVCDDQFKQLWKKSYTFAYESSKAPKNEIFVNNNGTVFILKQINLKKAFDQFSLFTLSSDGKTVIEKKIELGNGFTIASYKTLFTSEGDLQIAGFYYMNKKFGVNVETPGGNFHIHVNPLTGDLATAKINPELRGPIIATQLLALPDNSLCLVGENQVIGTTPIPGKPLEYTFNYTFGTTTLIKLVADGSQIWSYRIEKTMRSSSDGGRGLHTYAWVNGNDINVLFADAMTNHDERKQFLEFGDRRINLIQRIGADGKSKGETLITDPRIGGKKGEYLFIPSTGSLYKDNKLFMLASRGLELVGATISY
jgi:hypothetical protein